MVTRSVVVMLAAGFCLSLSCGAVDAQEGTAEKEYVKKLKAIHVKLTEMGARRERLMDKYCTENNYSGYPDLVQVLLRSVVPPKGGCKTPGPMLPLDVIEGWCRKGRKAPDTVILDHKPEEVREAYRQTWLERNSVVEEPGGIEEILEGKVSLVVPPPGRLAGSQKELLEELTKRHITLTKVPSKQKRMLNWIDSADSGYRDLVKVVLRAIPKSDKDRVKGDLIPLDVLEQWCRDLRHEAGKARDADTVIYDHTEKEVRAAYVEAWYELNPDPRDLNLEQILKGE